MISYKIKWASIDVDENGFPFIKVRLVERFIDGKYDKFISLKQGLEIMDRAVFNETEFDSVMSKAEKKAKYREKQKQLF